MILSKWSSGDLALGSTLKMSTQNITRMAYQRLSIDLEAFVHFPKSFFQHPSHVLPFASNFRNVNTPLASG